MVSGVNDGSAQLFSSFVAGAQETIKPMMQIEINVFIFINLYFLMVKLILRNALSILATGYLPNLNVNPPPKIH
jgi:hypothetical protein